MSGMIDPWCVFCARWVGDYDAGAGVLGAWSRLGGGVVFCLMESPCGGRVGCWGGHRGFGWIHGTF